MIPTEIHLLKKLFIFSVIRSAFFILLILLLLLFNLYPVSENSDVYVILLFTAIYVMFSIKYFQKQIQLWKNIPRYRFISWYYISFSIIWIVTLLALSIVSYFLFSNTGLTLFAFIIFLIEVIEIYLIYTKSLHFIAIKPNHIMIVKKRINIITPKDIQEVYYRNDILIFKLLNEKTVFVNFLETSNTQQLRIQIAEWLQQNNLLYNEIIERLFEASKK